MFLSLLMMACIRKRKTWILPDITYWLPGVKSKPQLFPATYARICTMKGSGWSACRIMFYVIYTSNISVLNRLMVLFKLAHVFKMFLHAKVESHFVTREKLKMWQQTRIFFFVNSIHDPFVESTQKCELTCMNSFQL